MYISEDQAGYYAGYIASSMMIGRCLSSYPWGAAADTYGRKPVINIGLFAIALFSVAFGFSNSMIWALSARFLLGLFNPVIGIAKTLVSEVALGIKQHEVRGMGMLTGTWGLGLIFGPAVGGLLSRPTTAYPGVFNEDNLGTYLYRLLCIYPYIIPNVVTAIVSLVALVLFQFHFTETLEFKPKHTDSNLGKSDEKIAEISIFNPIQGFNKGPAYQKVNINEQDSSVDKVDVELANVGSSVESSSLAMIGEGGDDNSEYTVITGKHSEDLSTHCTGSAEKSDEGVHTEPTSGWSLLFYEENSGKVQKVLAAYFLLSIVSVMLDETVPLWALSSVAAGGLFYQPSVRACTCAILCILLLFRVYMLTHSMYCTVL